MKSIRHLYVLGNGPSSSHTMGPKKAAIFVKEKYKDADNFVVKLYGSLAKTGKGHLTDKAILSVLGENAEIILDTKTPCTVHPNTLEIFACKGENTLGCEKIYSVGGSKIKVEGEDSLEEKEMYTLVNFSEIKREVQEQNISLLEYILRVEGEDVLEFAKEVLACMLDACKRGIEEEGMLPGRLHLARHAREIYLDSAKEEDADRRKVRLLSSFAIAVAEENACGGKIVTAPTCGACGVVPSVAKYLLEEKHIPEEKVCEGLLVAGLFGNLAKQNASISGAMCGCQAEIGVACSMASSMYAWCMGESIDVIERAAVIAMEHFLGLTCDPVMGYVQIPCIERNAIAAMRAVDASYLASMQKGTSKITYDLVLDTMYETGKDLKSHYRETSTGGLAKKYCRNKYYNEEIT